MAHLRAERDALAQLQTAMDIAGMRQAAGEASADFHAIMAAHGSTVERLRSNAASALQEYQNFRARNRLVRLARQPPNRPLSVAVGIFLIVLESIFNAVFFAGGSDLGILGGVILAASFSAVNVGVAALNGWFPLRWINHRNIVLKSLGSISFIVLLFASICLNGFVAHYRDLSQSLPDSEPLQAAYFGLFHSPLHLESIESWFLLMLGVVLAVVAVAKGYGLDDPYPGYGAHDRRRAHSERAYEEARQDVLESATAVRDDFTAVIREKIETLRGSSSQRRNLLSSRARNLAEFQAHEVHLAHAAQHLLSIYRTANESRRPTPAPAYFRWSFKFPDQALDRPGVRALLEDEGLEVDAEGLVQELDGLRHDVLARYAELVRPPAVGANS
jgi:hypothetical protein